MASQPGFGGDRGPGQAQDGADGRLRTVRFDEWKMTPWHVLSQEKRLTTFDEVVQGFDEDDVRNEAERCILCKHPTCVSGCPNNNPIPTYIAFVQEGRILDAAVADYEKNSLAACTGRVCAWERQCEGHCVLNARGEGVRIGAIERFIADYALSHRAEFEALIAKRAAERAARGRSAYTDPAVSPFAAVIDAYGRVPPPEYAGDFNVPDNTPLSGFAVAVVGAGPAGLSCADFLSRRGCAVTIFEAQKYAGGLLADGIPEFVLPEGTVDREVARLQDQGVVFRFETALGRDIQLEELRQAFDAVFLGFGAVKARRTGVPGEDAEGVWVAQQFLQYAKVALSHQGVAGFRVPSVGKQVLVIGAGDTAMDAARTSVRLGAEKVHIVYRRTRAESPSRDSEIEHTMAEGVTFHYLVNPVEYLKDERGHVRAARLVRMHLGEPDASGRRSPEPTPGSEFDMPCDTVIMAVGYGVGGEVAGHPEILNRNGTIRTPGGVGGPTPLEGVFAGGDVVRGAMTVVHAIRDGRDAADMMGRYLLSKRDGSGREAGVLAGVGAAG
jgi:glutamate synthase (NADPH/NADH) small chain